MRHHQRFLAILRTTSALCITSTSSAHAADFTVGNGVTETTTQTIGAGASETGTVDAGGTIATTANSDHGALSTSVGGTILNNGTITAAGTNASGLRSNVANNILTNNNSITIGGSSAAGILSDAGNTTITNNGTITANGTQGFGIFITSGSGSVVTNNGSITTNGSQGYAIYLFTGNNTATNNGSITTTNFSGIGMFSNTAGNTLVNNGDITTNGNGEAYGMLTNTTSNLTNNGRVVANGAANALRSAGNNVTITNAGYALSVGSNTVAMTGTNNALVMKANSTVDGTVVYSGGGTRTLTYDVADTGRSGSVTRITGAITGTPTESITNIPAGMRAIQSGETVVVLSPDQFGSSSQIVSQTVNDAGNVVNNRQTLALLGDTTEANGGTQYAASGSSTSDASNPNDWAVRDRKVAWAEGFGSYQERGETNDTSDSKARSGGVLAGVDMPQTDAGIRSGFYVGGFGGALDVGSFRDVNSTGAMAGGYVGKSYGEYYVSGGLGVGMSNNESDRFTGIDTASADYNSYFLSPSLTVMRPIKREGVTLVPTAILRYTAQRDSNYNESGSAINQSVASHTSHSLDGRLMLEAKLDAKKLKNGSILKPSLRAGLQGHTMFGSNATDVTVLGNSLSLDPNGNDHTMDGIIGVNSSYTLNERTELYADAEANLGLNKGGPSKNKGIIGRLGAKWKM